jgi:hypothetical protein
MYRNRLAGIAMSASDFAWTFPVYILARNYQMDPATESVIFDENIRFITPEAFPNGPRAIALFTDADLGEDFRDQGQDISGVDLLPFHSPAALRGFLARAMSDYQVAVVDLNRKTRRCTPFTLAEVISEMDRMICDGG